MSRTPSRDKPTIAASRVEPRRRPGRKMLLWVDDVTVSFDGFKALDDLTLDARRGRAALHHRPERRRQDDADGRHHRQDAARRRHASSSAADDRPHASSASTRSRALGIGRKFQRPTVFQGHNVFENLELAAQGAKSVLAQSLFGAARAGAARPHRRGRSRPSGSPEQRERRAGLLSHGQKQWLEIGMLLVQDPKVLLVDEPVAGMTHAGDGAHRRAAAARWPATHTVVVVEHDMEFVRSIARTRHRAARGPRAGRGQHGRGADRPARRSRSTSET